VIEPAVTALGYELLGCEVHSGGQRVTARVYIDKETGITAEDCAQASRQISAVLSVEGGVLTGAYHLEVSSPGVDRPLFKAEHYQRFLNHPIRVRLGVSVDGRRNYTGVLTHVDTQGITVTVDGVAYQLAFKEIART